MAAAAAAYTIGEAEGYVRKKLRDGSHTEDPEKKNDHAMDACRYLIRAAATLNAGGLATGDEPKVVPAHAYD